MSKPKTGGRKPATQNAPAKSANAKTDRTKTAKRPRARRLRAPGLDDGESPFFPIRGIFSAAEY